MLLMFGLFILYFVLLNVWTFINEESR